MRTTIALLLALGVAAPALAQQTPDDAQHQHDHGDRAHDHAGQQGGRDNRGNANWHPGQPPSAGGQQTSNGWHQDNGAAASDQGAPGWHGGSPPAATGPDHRNTPAGGWDHGNPQQGGRWNRDTPPPPSGGAGWNHGAPPPRAGGWNGGRPPASGGNWNHGPHQPPQWDRGWRGDQRYDWYRFRAYNRNLFRAPPYYAPRGFAYRPWFPGLRIDPWFYGRDYWISDPYAYHLPPAPPGCEWVRYYNDIALVNIYDGTVLDVVSGFFY